MSIGERILIALEKSGKNQADLARYLSTKPSTVTGWIKEGRIPSANSIIPICVFTDVSADWLLTGDEQNQSITISKPSSDIAARYEALCEDGRALVRAALINAEDRFGQTKSNNSAISN
jgi:transcriptional regulator with XRE-family HTH domain